jgi:hypothetical protein
MENKTVYKVRNSNGRFVKKAEKNVRVAFHLLPETRDELASYILDGETMSDVIRKAIALFMKEQQALDLLDEIINNAVSVEEALPPHEEYVIDGELVRKAAKLLHES